MSRRKTPGEPERETSLTHVSGFHRQMLEAVGLLQVVLTDLERLPSDWQEEALKQLALDMKRSDGAGPLVSAIGKWLED